MFFLSKQDHSPNIVLICEKEEANPLTTPPSIQGLQFNHPKAIASAFFKFESWTRAKFNRFS